MTEASTAAMTLAPHDALVVVDVQNDFLPGGSLAVPDGAAVVPVLNRCLARWHARGLPIVLSRDWHPPAHCSFHAQGGPWPPHCVRDTPGAAFPRALAIPSGSAIVAKGTAPERDAYSAFDGTDLDARLRAGATTRVFIGGLATDYCVLATARDARARGYETVVLRDAIRAVERAPGDGARAEAAMRDHGATLVPTSALRP